MSGVSGERGVAEPMDESDRTSAAKNPPGPETERNQSAPAADAMMRTTNRPPNRGGEDMCRIRDLLILLVIVPTCWLIGQSSGRVISLHVIREISIADATTTPPSSSSSSRPVARHRLL
jgi:hypothetical protein